MNRFLLPSHRIMNQFLRLLLLAPTTFSSIMTLAIAAPSAQANSETWVPVTPDVSCKHTTIRETRQLVCKRIQAGSGEAGKVVELTKTALAGDPIAQTDANASTFEMTDEESDTASVLFGCDCPVCVRSLRQLRNMTL